MSPYELLRLYKETVLHCHIHSHIIIGPSMSPLDPSQAPTVFHKCKLVY